MKLPGFPVPNPGEALASVVARYLARSATPKTLQLRLLGLSRFTRASSIIPTNLCTLASVMPIGHPWESAPELIADGYTLVPLFLHFAHPERAADTMSAIIAGNSRNPSASLGITSAMSGRLQSGQRFCPDCVARDIEAFGFPVLHRQHQAPFVKMCIVHARPLHFSCLHCDNVLGPVGSWQLAGRCTCSQPHTPPLLEMGLDAKTEEGWLWLARQVTTILGEPESLPKVSVTANLLTALRNGGFTTKGGLDSIAITKALLDRFGESFLKQVGCASLCSPQWLRSGRMLNLCVVDGRRIPYVLRMLLLARVVTDNIASLWNRVAPEPTPKRECLPGGYPRTTRSNRTHVDKDVIAPALDAAKGKITVAAGRLRVSPNVLAADMRHYGIRLPLPAITLKRIGPKRLPGIREALLQGIPKNKIQQQHDVSEWLILLVELDQPELGQAHRDATIAMLQIRHRNTLLSFLRDHPSAFRRAFSTSHAGTYDWLLKYDRNWFEAHFPRPVYGKRIRPRKPVKGWDQLDQTAVSIIQRAGSQELAKSGRPIRLTRTRLLSAANAAAALNPSYYSYRYPRAAAEANRLAESREQFMHRKLRWALERYACEHKVISINQLRRVAGLAPRQLLEYRDCIIELAAELELSFHARCALAPWHDDLAAVQR